MGLMTAEAPRFQPDGINNNDDLEQHLKARGLKFEKTHGSYGGHENSYIIHGPTRETMFDLGRRAGQEAVVYSQNGRHELTYTAGPNAGKFHPSLPLVSFQQTPPEDYYTHLPGKGYFSLHFDFDKKNDSPVNATMPAVHGPASSSQQPLAALKAEVRLAILQALRKGLSDEPSKPHPHAYPYHEGHSSYHQRTAGPGILLTTQEFADMLPLAKSDPLLPAPAAPPANEQAAGKGVSTFAKYAGPFGTVNKGQSSDLKHYPMEGVGPKVDNLLKDHGYTVYYAGGKHGKPDLAGKNYNTGHLMIYDPSAGSGGDFGHQDYTDSWRKTHELAHALTLNDINAKYGEGRRMGGLGKHRSLREAKRAVEWEHLAVHKQRELNAQVGVHVPDHVFNREYNTVMGDAVHRAITGKFTEPSDEGFAPHSHQVPLSVAHSMLDEHAAQIGLRDQHDLSKALEDLLQVVRSHPLSRRRS